MLGKQCVRVRFLFARARLCVRGLCACAIFARPNRASEYFNTPLQRGMRVIINHLSQFSLMHISVLFCCLGAIFARCLCFVFSVMKRMLFRSSLLSSRLALPSSLFSKRPNVPIHHGVAFVDACC